MLQDLRRLDYGTLTASTVLVGDPLPESPTPGVSVSLDTLDVDGDGTEELVQVRGTANKPTLRVTDGATGVQVWERPMPTIYFSPRVVADGTGRDDVLLFDSGFVRRLDGATGNQLWSRSMPFGDAQGYWGVSPSPDGGDIVVGAWTDPDVTEQTALALEFRSFATGLTRGTMTVTGKYTPPTAGLAGDLDGDGVGDLYTLSPLNLYGPASGGVIRTHTGRGAAVGKTTAFAVPASDDSYLISSVDATGDGRRDPILVSDWLGALGVSRAETIVSVVDGAGNERAGLQPVAQEALSGYPDVFTTPGDLNGDGGQDLVFSGAVHYPASNEASVLFEAFGRGGIIWQGGPRYAVAISEMGAGWWSDAGDLNGDGMNDALVLLGSLSTGVDMVAAVDLRGGSTLWSRAATAGHFALPAFGDLDGDGGDDVLSDFWAWHPETTQTAFRFTAATGDDLEPLWDSMRIADSGANGWSIYALGGRFDDTGNEDVLAEYVMSGSGRHLAEAFHGGTGERLWSSP